jgi:uncharacterized protein (DUF849 family)
MDRRAFLTVAGVGLVAMKPQSRLPLLKSTINGGRPRGSHPALPTTPEECARTAGAVVAAGAGAVHVHIRDADGAESLAAADLARTLVAMRSAAPGTPIGISTHFRILNDVGRRRDAVAAWTVVPDFASVNFHEEGAVELARQLLEQGVAVEAGLFQADAARVCVESGMAPRCLRLMLEPGGGPLADVLANVAEMEAVLDASGTTVPRLLHGGGDNSWAVVDEAARRGYQTRVGFEDSFLTPDGSTARDNAEMVAEALRRIRRIAG